MRQLQLVLLSVSGLLMVLPGRADVSAKLGARIENGGQQHEVVKYTPKPIPCGPDAKTAWQNRQEQAIPFFKKQLLDPFLASEEKNVKWASAFVSQLENMCAALAERRLMNDYLAWQRACSFATNSKCKCPPIRWMQAMGLHKKSNTPQAKQILQDLDAELTTTPDQWFAKLLVGIGYHRIEPSQKNEALLVTRLTDWIQKGGLTRDDSKYVYYVMNSLPFDLRPAILASFEKTPSIDPWLTLMLRGSINAEDALGMRNNGYLDTLTAEEEKVFKQKIFVASKALEEAWRLNPEVPYAATLMIGVACCSRREEMRMWFDRAVATEYDGVTTYVNYIKYSRPKWGGSIEEMSAFAETCYQTQRHDTTIPLFYATIMFQIAEELKCDLREVFTRPGVREKCVEVLDAQAQNQKNVSDVRNLAGELLPVVEYVGGDLRKALEYNLRRKLARTVNTRGFLPNDYDLIFTVLNPLRWLPPTSPLIAAEELYLAGQYEEALAKLIAVREEARLKGRIDLLPYEEEDYLYYRINCIELETLFKRGEWMTPTLKKRCPGWFNPEKDWSFGDKGLRTDKEMSPLKFMTALPADVECEGVLSFFAPPGQESKLCFQLDKRGADSETSVVFSYADNKCHVSMGNYYDPMDAKSASIPSEKPEARFKIVTHKNMLSVWVNGKQLLDKKDLSKNMDPLQKKGMLLLTLYGTRVAFSDLRMRSPDVTAAQKPGK